MEVIVAFDATFESMTFDARHGVGDGDGGQAAATIESKVSDARHTVGNYQIGYFFLSYIQMVCII